MKSYNTGAIYYSTAEILPPIIEIIGGNYLCAEFLGRKSTLSCHNIFLLNLIQRGKQQLCVIYLMISVKTLKYFQLEINISKRKSLIISAEFAYLLVSFSRKSHI